MYWSDKSLGGIFEVAFEDIDAVEVTGGNWENLLGRISGHILPDS